MLFDKEKLITEYAEPVTVTTPYGEVVVKQQLPAGDKLDLIADIVNASVETTGYYNPCRVKIWWTIKMIFAYSDLELDPNIFDAENGGDLVYGIYDTCTYGWLGRVFDAIPVEEREQVFKAAEEVGKAVYTYTNSARGIMEGLTANYEDFEETTEGFKAKASDPNALSLVKNVLDKLG